MQTVSRLPPAPSQRKLPVQPKSQAAERSPNKAVGSHASLGNIGDASREPRSSDDGHFRRGRHIYEIINSTKNAPNNAMRDLLPTKKGNMFAEPSTTSKQKATYEACSKTLSRLTNIH